MKVIVVIPVHGRLPLLKLTIERLYLKNKVSHVICVGERANEKTCTDAGAEFIQHPNKPIGRKLNKGFQRAKELKPDAVSFVGSSDWLSDNWFDVTLPYTEKYHIVGKRSFNMVHVTDHVIVAEWLGYPFGSGRVEELIGIGRVCSSEFLDNCNWKPFDDALNNSLDWSMWSKLKKIQDAKECDYPNIQSLSISCDKWSNMHNFNGLLLKSIVNPHSETWLNKWFPEIY
jgi:hypothetical protein